MKKGRIYIGTSGWSYKHWKGTFYPTDVKVKDWFAYYQTHFDTVEINSSFYHLPTAKTFEKWRMETAEDFLFVVKASRYITHMKKLLGSEESVDYFLENATELKEKLGPILFQLPPGWALKEERFETFLTTLPTDHRYVFEFRNPTWYDDRIKALLIKHNCGFCIYELDGHISPEWVTSDFVYLRLHGPGAKYQGSYPNHTLNDWARKCERWKEEGKDVFVYFDNDQNGYAPANALYLQKELGIQKQGKGKVASLFD